MKVAYLLGSLNRGGTETLLLDVINHIQDTDFQALCIHRKRGVLESDFRNSGKKMIHLPTVKNIFKYLFRLRKTLKSEEVNIVHAQQAIDAFYARMACIASPIRVVLTTHGFDYDVKGFYAFLLPLILKTTDLNLYVSNYQKDYYSTKYKLNKCKQKLVYNGLSFAKFKSSNLDPIDLRAEFKISPNSYLMASVGNFVPGRDQLTLCRFITLLKKKSFDFHFIFIGKKSDTEPNLYDDCVSYCNANNLMDVVSFAGSRSDVPEILKQIDAFVYATDHDTFGIAVVEAMYNKLPVFVNDWQVMSEITGNGKYALLYKTKDEHDLLDKFLKYQQNNDILDTSAASKYIQDNFSIENHIRSLKSIYQSLL
jgi:glycosyltransferase involved in cell wall biosynthesis